MKLGKMLKIEGRVQGVGYRESMLREAIRLRVTGWVKNRADGSVEALVQADHATLEKILAWCHRGPPAARVERISEKAAEFSPDFTDFPRRETE